MTRGIRLILGVALAFAFVLPLAITSTSASPTGYEIAPEFQEFYTKHGGLQTFGYAISPPLTEDGRLVQYTERQRLEHHPEHAGSEYEVLLGLLGRESARRDGRSFAAGEAISGARYFELTDHYLHPHFQRYWESNGGIRIFGYPITAPQWEDGLLVQYTERARFEYHPDHTGSAYDVLLGHLGRETQDGVLDRQVAAPTENENSTSQPSNVEQMLIDRLNEERRNAGVPALQPSNDIAGIAQGRSGDMAERQYFSHHTPDGRTVFDEMRSAGLSWSLAGETLHRNRADADDLDAAVDRAIRGFMNSSEHRRILTDDRYQLIGAGHEFGDDGRHYFTVVVMAR